MKRERNVFFILFGFSVLVSVVMLYNLFRRSGAYGMGPVIAFGCGLVALQLAGLVSVIINRHRIVMGVLSIVTGIAVLLTGRMAFGYVGAPAPQWLGILSLASMWVSLLLCIGYVGVGTAFLCKRP